MGTLKVAQQLEKAGLPTPQAEAVSRIVNDLGRADLVTKDHLDVRLLQHTLATIAAFAMIAGMFKLFS
ncbi:hypothetical protein [Hyphomicrobium sp.]|uniref:hypothetical protein n=1 Tax=Hyphomicrobium sp. TaxID=82 RepID=UPI002FE32BA6